MWSSAAGQWGGRRPRAAEPHAVIDMPNRAAPLGTGRPTAAVALRAVAIACR